MADDEFPSFSLGLDSDSDTAPLSPDPKLQDPDPVGAGDDDFELQSELPGPDSGFDAPRTLRRLRRGMPTNSTIPCPNVNAEDDIEEFSSPEEVHTVEKPSVRYQSGCSSSKLPLIRQSGITAPLSNQLSVKRPSEDAGSVIHETSCNKLFQKSTVSPVRKFLLVDSDSDGPSTSEHVEREANKSGIPSKRKTEAQKDLWEDFQPVNSFRISTPAFDEVCDEYFRSVKSKNQSQAPTVETFAEQRNKESMQHEPDLTNPLPPSHRYFFHSDQRIQNLVHTRLPHFFPLGGSNNRGSEQPNSSVINYMSQFCNGEASRKQGTQKLDGKKRSRMQNSSRTSASEETACPESWVNPKSSASATARNAGKRRVHANGKSAGRWYTRPDGQKVYVTGSGEELTGSSAYRLHRKESGLGFKKSKKKQNAKKKAKR